ncbi:DNA-binding MarR family transcriptional regulator [Nocardioides marinisabuli]|uniref:DNA-binding MarR family transcriptional regulator n=1 Tax=Nocardioides marinisabuli TaxID=419476 RepID=A0A7Y9EYR8_9ACTN|nr:MarR family transcriptional regulator [Nocardioides marinisabuli]NYD56447.1 DNA-binding MarR family transcriptional regulator [Nocardioides marinisabuli]
MTASRAESLMRLEQEVGVLIRRVKRVIGERSRAVHPDLQPASYLMLAYLGQHGPMRASAAAEMFHIDKGAISRQVTHLVELGLVERTQDPDDGRASLISATPSAVERLTAVAENRRQWLDERLGDWDAAELEEFTRVLGRYNEALNQG